MIYDLCDCEHCRRQFPHKFKEKPIELIKTPKPDVTIEDLIEDIFKTVAIPKRYLK